MGIKYNNKFISSNLTSPETINLHKNLEIIKKAKIDNVIVEASSHGLDQKRLDNLDLKAGIFTNFSQDHLDYHRTMRLYLKAKLRLFKNIIKKKKIVISDRSNKEFKILKKISKKRKLKLIDINSIKEKLKNYKDLKFNEIYYKNLSMAIVAAKLCNLKEKKIFGVLNKLKDVNGRLELIRTFSNNIKVYVDFAHTPDALDKSIKVIKKLHGDKLSLVFGCGGDRDFKKRPLMGKIANKHCKKIYVTDDNPRNENPKKIRGEIIKKIKTGNYFNIGNRQKAIKAAITNADPNEIILISGKGHEEEQIYKNKILSISDKQIVKKLKLKLKKKSNKKLDYLQNQKILKEIIKNSKANGFHGIAIDSREVRKNNLFLTIKGKYNHGAKFSSQALKKGAKYIVSAVKNNIMNSKLIKVKNEIKFLNHFALIKRENTNAKIIGVTGSAGKTSLKNLIKDLLKRFGDTHYSPKSYNNHFGVPLSLSQLNTRHQFAVFEIGMSKVGEINKLSKLIKPHIGIITNIGEAHIENFKNLKGIAEAKSEIMNNIKKNGIIILNRDDKYFNYLYRKAKIKKLKVISFGFNKKSDVHPISITKSKKYKIISIKIYKKILKLKINNINIHNILSSLALLKVLDLDLNKITSYFKNHQPSEGRGRVYNIKRYKKKFKLIDESYNANPLSVKTAIENLNLIKKKNFKKYLLLGDMLELGDKSEMLHKKLSKVINSSDIDKVFIKGNNALVTLQGLNKKKRGNIFQKDEDVDFTLNSIISNNDYLMIKGSNATGLNNLSKRMIKGY